MSNKKITQLDELTAVADGDILPVVDVSASRTKRITRQNFLGIAGTPQKTFNVIDYGATGDGVTDDSTAIQSAITALETADGGILFFPSGSTYKIVTGLVFDPANLTSMAQVQAYGATISYTGTGDAIKIENNVTAVDDQDAEKSYHFYGLHIKGTSSADCAIRLKACFCSFRDTVIENFTTVTSQQAAIVLDALFLEWVEENTFDGLDIKNTGHGICFISREDSGGAAASCMNNYFRNVHIWLKQDNGRGFYGVGLGASTNANIGRVIIDGAVVHPFEADGVTCFNFTNCFSDGVVLISPSVDAYGVCNTLTAFSYNNAEMLTVISPTGYPLAEVDTYFSGGGGFNIISGNFGAGTQSFQNYDSDLVAIAAITPSNDDVIQRKAGAWANRTMAQVKTDLVLAKGDVGLGSVDNTADTAKPVSTATATSIATKMNKEFFERPDYTTGNYSTYGDYAAVALGTTGDCYFTFTVPADFNAFTSVSVIGIADTTETIQFDIDTDYAQIGEPHTTNTGQSLNVTQGVTLNTIWSYDLKSTLTSVTAGEVIGIKFGSDTDFLYILGLRVRYS